MSALITCKNYEQKKSRAKNIHTLQISKKTKRGREREREKEKIIKTVRKEKEKTYESDSARAANPFVRN